MNDLVFLSLRRRTKIGLETASMSFLSDIEAKVGFRSNASTPQHFNSFPTPYRLARIRFEKGLDSKDAGREYVIAYASESNNKAKSDYSSYEGEIFWRPIINH